MNTAICSESLAKSYVLGADASQRETLREALRRTASAPFRALRRDPIGARKPIGETLWALRDVSFDIKHGEVVGLVGRNGAGKSTLLKILSRITSPSSGRAVIHGRVGSLLEVGTGFHPELTGRENIFLNGAVLGMTRADIHRKFDEIVAFSEVERFLDTPVKHYSSGMYMRLAFSVAAHLEPEVLLIDEVLAVGDIAFQKKCMGKMNDVGREGRTVVFVSHNLGAVRALCSRAIWISDGIIQDDGAADRVVTKYTESSHATPRQSRSKGWERLTVGRAVVLDEAGNPTTQVKAGSDLTVEVHYHAKTRIDRPHFFVALTGPSGPLCVANMLFDGFIPDVVEGPGWLRCTFKKLGLAPQFYSVLFGARDSGGSERLLVTADVAHFTIAGAMADYGMDGATADAHISETVPLIWPYEWERSDGAKRSVEMRWTGTQDVLVAR